MPGIADRVRVLAEADELRAAPREDRKPARAPVPSTHHAATLRVIPLVAESIDEPQYRLLGPETSSLVRIEEVEEEGSVPHLRITNQLEDSLLIIDSQAIIGLKQNRAVNTDLLIGAGQTIIAPVSCVEAGRWGRSAHPSIAGDLIPRGIRARKMISVSQSLQSRLGFTSDQSEVWSEIQSRLRASRTASGSSALHELYEQRRQTLAEARAALALPEDAVGAAVYIGKRFVGLDLFDKASTMREIWKGVADSYMLDWIVSRFDAEDAERDGVEMGLEGLLDEIADAEWQPFDSPGRGTSMRMESEHVAGSALVVDARSVIHLQAFPRPAGHEQARDDEDVSGPTEWEV